MNTTTTHPPVQAAKRTACLRILPPHLRQRAIRGLAEPNLARTYTAREREERWPVINGLREAVSASNEPTEPLWPFLPPSARAAIERARRSLESRRFWGEWSDEAIAEASDVVIASIPGLRARHIFDARLRRYYECRMAPR